MLNRIRANYNNYISIYENIIPNISDNTARRFLENSLYLSIFTSFEFFIKHMINDYVNKITEQGIKYIELKDEIARKYMLENERKNQILNIYKENESQSKRSFDAYFRMLQEPLSKQDLSKYIRFEFFHESKLNTHYKMIFSQILGASDFLKEIRVTKNEPDNIIEQTIHTDGFTFISNYCKEIRNNIAHNNDNYAIDSEFSFIDAVNAFQHIMDEMKNKYEAYTGFSLSESSSENILDSF